MTNDCVAEEVMQEVVKAPASFNTEATESLVRLIASTSEGASVSLPPDSTEYSGQGDNIIPIITALLQQGANLLHILSEGEAKTWSLALGSTLLHLAAQRGNQDLTLNLITLGIPWNVTNSAGQSVGDIAREAGHAELYEALIHEGVRSEMVLMMLDACTAKESSEENHEMDFLSKPLTYSEGKLLDSDANAVMMGWETPLMVMHAQTVCPRPGVLSVLNIGFGLGIIDSELQKCQPIRHVIIEAHPDVYRRMVDEGWDKREGVEIVFGRWQDVIHDLGLFDGIFFDTFGENYDDLREFQEEMVNHLAPGGIYSYFNGLAGTNLFFHHVYLRVVEADLADLGMHVEYVKHDMDKLGDEVWQGIKREYWSLSEYHLPIVRFAHEL